MNIHYMNLNEEPFMAIKEGSKTIEMRLYDEKRRKVKVGDVISFTNLKTQEVLKTKVTALYVYSDFKTLYEHFDPLCLGYKEHEVVSYEDMYSYYKEEDIKKYGVIGIRITVIA